jgi:hypothetical protein
MLYVNQWQAASTVQHRPGSWHATVAWTPVRGYATGACRVHTLLIKDFCIQQLVHELAAIARDLQIPLLLLLVMPATVLASLTLLPLNGFETEVSSFSHS